MEKNRTANIKLRFKKYNNNDDKGEGVVVFDTTNTNNENIANTIFVGGIEYGGDKNKIEKIKVNGEEQTIIDKTINIEIPWDVYN